MSGMEQGAVDVRAEALSALLTARSSGTPEVVRERMRACAKRLRAGGGIVEMVEFDGFTFDSALSTLWRVYLAEGRI